MNGPFVVGQRWVSESEPELGMGRVTAFEGGRVTLHFPAAREDRLYAMASAPLRRVLFKPGDSVRTAAGQVMTVAEVRPVRGCVAYVDAAGVELPESDLGEGADLGTPEDRLKQGRVDEGTTFELRRSALQHQHARRKSPVRGFVGGRMDLIPHQLYLAREVSARQQPRVLLADEVGLGKTVEACLILHRLLATGRASRVLVVVPESLVHQWFVELLRRFNLWFHIFDEERCDAISAAQPGNNPFLDDQLVLCGLPLLLHPERGPQAAAAGWDLLVVDEAHHLGWSPTDPSPEYTAVEAVSRRAEGLLLLTATPEQLGLESHFARLRLLDPDRYFDLEKFRQESSHYAEVAALAARLLEGGPLGSREQDRLQEILGGEPERIRKRLEALSRGDAAARQELVGDLLDRHGTGRVMFRNTRAAIRGFPRRVPCPEPLKAPPGDDGVKLLEMLAREFEADNAPARKTAALPPTEGAALPKPRAARPTLPDLRADPRIMWLVSLLRRLGNEKVLLICRTREKVLAIDEALRAHVTVGIAQFHEGLDLVQRDRSAAWFADPEGATILLASEIGSEGRNFQFAHHLVLFDLPLDPELVEQRIGRLDRVGQTEDIRIHLPHVLNSAGEVVFRWMHEGLAAFERPLAAGRELREKFAAAARDLALDFHETESSRRAELKALVKKTQAERRELEQRLEQGRDRLLELSSFRPEAGAEIARSVAAMDAERHLEEFLLRVWDHYGVPVEDLGPHTYKLGGDGVYAESFPGVPVEGILATLDRRQALSREDLTFLSWDHPMVTGALDLLLGGTAGTTSVVSWDRATEKGLWLECVHVLECLAPAPLHVDRFLPATPIRGVVDVRGQTVTATQEASLLRLRLPDLRPHELFAKPGLLPRLSAMAEAARALAEKKGQELIQAAREKAERDLGHEIERLRALAAVNPGVRAGEIAAWEAQRDALREHLAHARLRLDALRLIRLGVW